MTFFSEGSADLVTLSNIAGNKTLPSIVVPPVSGYEILYGRVGVIWNGTENGNAGGVNYIPEDQWIQVKKSGGTFIDGAKIPRYTVNQVASDRAVSYVNFVGSEDVISEVDAFDSTYEFQWKSGRAAAVDINIFGITPYVQFGVKPI